MNPAQPIQIYEQPASVLPLAAGQPEFTDTMMKHRARIRRGPIKTLQINIGKKCDLACTHCHVEAGPKRTENMESATIDRLLDLLARAPGVATVDVTGGAPELNPHFRRLVTGARALGKRVMDRCNLTVLFRRGQEDTAEFLAANGVEIVASLPCYSPENVDQQRGRGVFARSVKALKKLNALGYAKPDSGLVLNLVYNPVGAHLPPPQAQLEADYKERLSAHLGVEFNNLYTITNMPIKRYVRYLRRQKLFASYMQLLIDNFNAAAASGVMCTELVSIGYDGKIYDCDFNQMLDIPINYTPLTIWQIDSIASLPRAIAFDNHCYGCTAGAGSSCGGALV
jgi:radical SAM/Cys-rich protein